MTVWKKLWGTSDCRCLIGPTGEWSPNRMPIFLPRHPFTDFPISLNGTQFSSVVQSCPTLHDPMNRSTPGLPVHYQLPESTQIHVHRVGNATKPSHPLSSPSPPALNLYQHQGLFQWVGFTSSGQSVGASASAPVLPMNIQGWFSLGLTGLISLLSKGLSRVFSGTTIRKHQFYSTQPSLWSNSHIHTWLFKSMTAEFVNVTSCKGLCRCNQVKIGHTGLEWALIHWLMSL